MRCKYHLSKPFMVAAVSKTFTLVHLFVLKYFSFGHFVSSLSSLLCGLAELFSSHPDAWPTSQNLRVCA